MKFKIYKRIINTWDLMVVRDKIVFRDINHIPHTAPIIDQDDDYIIIDVKEKDNIDDTEDEDLFVYKDKMVYFRYNVYSGKNTLEGVCFSEKL